MVKSEARLIFGGVQSRFGPTLQTAAVQRGLSVLQQRKCNPGRQLHAQTWSYRADPERLYGIRLPVQYQSSHRCSTGSAIMVTTWSNKLQELQTKGIITGFVVVTVR